MTERPQLHLVNADTGEVVEDERDVLIEQLQGELKGKSLQIGKLKKENRELRAVEPEAQDIKDVLGYWRDSCKPRAEIAIDGARWKKVRARLNDRFDDRPPYTPAELKLAIDGAMLDPWINGTHPKAKDKGFVLEAETIFRDPEQVGKLRDLALGFKAKTGLHLRDLLEVAEELKVVSWRFLLRACECGHRRIEHSRPDPNHQGQEGCFLCGCTDFYQDVLERLGKA